MQYDFDTVVERRGSNSYKWDSIDAGGAEYPLWVADMDWKAAEPIQQAIHERVEHGVFGYVTTPNSTRRVIAEWYKRRHRWTIRPEQISTAPSIVPALVAILRERPGKVLLNTPAYNCFFSAIEHAGCQLLPSPLLLRERRYEFDWEDMDRQMAEADIYLLCNPHNPTGRVWSEDELEHVLRLCEKHHVRVISDEIHCEFSWHGRYTPFGRLATERKSELSWIALTSATKAFNIAGLQFASIISSDAKTKDATDSALERSHLEDINPFGQVATIAAYTECEDWLEQVNRYIEGNYNYLCRWYEEHQPDCRVTRMEGTYLAWVDYRLNKSLLAHGTTEALCQYWLTERSVHLNAGEMYGQSGFVRINLACPRRTLQSALDRIKE